MKILFSALSPPMFLEHLEMPDTVVGTEDTALNRADKSSCFHPQGAFILGKQEKKKKKNRNNKCKHIPERNNCHGEK